MQPKKDIRHGTLYAYTAKHCRCDACRKANADKYQKSKLKRQLQDQIASPGTTSYPSPSPITQLTFNF